MLATLRASIERWPIAEPFHIARGIKREAIVVVAHAETADHRGRGESVPYARYGESVEDVALAIEALGAIESREALRERLPPGAARNAVDLALWDLESRLDGVRVHERLGLSVAPVPTARTIVLGDAAHARASAARLAGAAIVKVKAGGAADLDRLRAVREVLPAARLIADANEGWTPAALESMSQELFSLGVELIEQPLPAADDGALRSFEGPIPICADESARGEALEALADRYDAVCLKLDKQGGLTAALEAEARARAAGLRIMVGCMVSTSLAVAPAILLAQRAEWADLDGALLLARDREPGLPFDGRSLGLAPRALWG